MIAWLIAPHLFQGMDVRVGMATTGATAGYCWADFYNKLQQPANAEVMRNIDENGFLALLQRVISVYGNAGEA